MNDRLQFEGVYADSYDAVLRYCLRRAPRQDALDVAAETFAIAWRRRADLPLGKELPWLYGVARRVLANQRRSVRRRTAALARMGPAPGSVAADPEPQVVAAQETSELLAGLARLPTDDQELIRLAGWEGLSRQDLAVAMGLTPNAVTKRLDRALDRLAHEMGVAGRTGGRFFKRERVADDTP